jgi:hypothetical protein
MPMKDTDIDGLSPREAGHYVLHFITSLKTTRAQRRELAAELAVWRRRVALAAEKKAPDLEAEARLRADTLALREAALAEEEAVLTRKVGVLKEKLASLKLRGEMSTDTDRLLAELQLLAGPRDDLAEALKEAEADRLLAELKERLANENS